MPVYYGGLTLDPVEMLGDERVVVYDGPTYLYTIHRMHFRGTYNPATFSWILQGIPGDVLALNIPGQIAPTSDVATRLFLLQPRLQFAYWTAMDSFGNPVFDLVSPTAFPSSDINGSPVPFLTDAKNGPIPLSAAVVEVRGTKTFLVDWAIETYVNECFLFQDSQSLAALLSHRWVVEEDLDQDFFATRTITGHAIFRSDRLMALGATPDDYRSWLFHPVQDNFKRDVQQVILSEDNTQLDYVLIDREQAFNLVPAVVALGVTRIEAFYEHGYERTMSGEEGIEFAGLGTLQGIAAIALLPRSPIAAIEAGRMALHNLGNAVDAVPRYVQSLVVRVWGNHLSTRAKCYAVALGVLASITTLGDIFLRSGSIKVTEDILGKFISLNCNLRSGPIVGLIQAGATTIAQPRVGPDEIPGITQSQFSPQPTAPLDSGTRSSVYKAMAQTLAGICGVTPQANNGISTLRANPIPNAGLKANQIIKPQTLSTNPGLNPDPEDD